MSEPDPDKKIAAVFRGSAMGGLFGDAQVFGRPKDDHPIYNLVGRVASEWAHLEHWLDRIIWDLAEIDDHRGACITAQMMGVWPRYNAIEALLTQRAQNKPELNKFIEEVRKLSAKTRGPSEERNRIVHDAWFADQSDGKTAQLRSMPRPDLIYGLLDRDRDDILRTLRSITAITEKVVGLRLRIEIALRPSREKRR